MGFRRFDGTAYKSSTAANSYGLRPIQGFVSLGFFSYLFNFFILEAQGLLCL